MLALALVSMLAAAPPDLSDEAKKELKTLEGDWTVVSIASDGVEREAKADEQVAVTVKGTKFTFGKFGDGEVIALDTTTKPKLMDFKMLRKPASDYTNEAIFKVEKDTLTVVVYVGEGAKRPTDFDVPNDSQTIRLILKRAK